MHNTLEHRLRRLTAPGRYREQYVWWCHTPYSDYAGRKYISDCWLAGKLRDEVLAQQLLDQWNAVVRDQVSPLPDHVSAPDPLPQPAERPQTVSVQMCFGLSLTQQGSLQPIDFFFKAVACLFYVSLPMRRRDEAVSLQSRGDVIRKWRPSIVRTSSFPRPLLEIHAYPGHRGRQPTPSTRLPTVCNSGISLLISSSTPRRKLGGRAPPVSNSYRTTGLRTRG